MIKTRKEQMLEARIARLEKLLKSNNRLKNESTCSSSDIEEWFWDHCTEDDFDDRSDWKDHLFALGSRNDDMTVSMCVDDLGCDNWNLIENVLARCANQLIREEHLSKYDDDDTYEACSRYSRR